MPLARNLLAVRRLARRRLKKCVRVPKRSPKGEMRVLPRSSDSSATQGSTYITSNGCVSS
eukprot:3296470-Pleurochrysis_carterae.AAC.1